MKMQTNVYGFTIVNDFSVRDWQFRGPPHTLTMGKSWTHCPFGPYIVTSDEIEDPHNLVLKTYVNDEERQNSNTSLMIYDCFTLIEYLSTAFTLMPGDLIATGTPEGVALTTKDWLKPGDNVKVEIDKLGFIQNNIIQEPNNTSKVKFKILDLFFSHNKIINISNIIIGIKNCLNVKKIIQAKIRL